MIYRINLPLYIFTAILILSNAFGVEMAFAQIPTFISADKLDANPQGGTFDGDGNFYYFRNFNLTKDFDPGPGVFNLSTPSVDVMNAAIVKINAAGDFVWAKQIVSNFNSTVKEIIVDNAGNVFATGYFQPTADFDPGPGFFTLSTSGFADIFVLKLDNEGSLLFAKKMGGTQFDTGATISLDDTGNIYTAGYFEGTADFNPSVSLEFELTSFGDSDIFISKLDGGGNFIWAKKIGGTGADFSAQKIQVDYSDNIYLAGEFETTIDFNPSDLGVFNITPLGERDVFILKLNSSGSFTWAKVFSGTMVESVADLKIDASGNVYSSGWFYGTTDFNPGAPASNLTSLGQNDIFIVKLNASGNFVWAKQIGSVGNEEPRSMVLDNSDNICTTGKYTASTDFDPGPGTSFLANMGGDDLFVLKLNTSGDYIWAINFGSTGDDEGRYIQVNSVDDILLHGIFTNTVDFNPGPATYHLTSPTTISFLNRLSQTTVPLPVSLVEFEGNCTGDGVLLKWSTSSEINNAYFTIESSLDGVNFAPLDKIDASGNNWESRTYQFTDHNVLKATHYYRLKQTDFDGDYHYSQIISVDCHAIKDDFSIFPNPSNDGRFTLSLSDDGWVTVINTQGKFVKKHHYIAGEHVVDIGQPAGVYFINLAMLNKCQSRRLVIKYTH